MRVMSFSEVLVSAPPLAPAAPSPSEADAPFQRPGSDVLSETIPVAFIGRNRSGLWVARDADARLGGLFGRERAALDFARTNAAPRPCAIVFPQERFELDMPNGSNALLTPLADAMHLFIRQSQ